MKPGDNLKSRIAGVKKLVGKQVLVGNLKSGYRPENDPQPCIYVPLPEYGVYLLHYPSTTSEVSIGQDQEEKVSGPPVRNEASSA